MKRILKTFHAICRTKLYQMCKCSEVQDFIRKVDYTFYQNLVEVLMPNVLRPIPSEFDIDYDCIFLLLFLINV